VAERCAEGIETAMEHHHSQELVVVVNTNLKPFTTAAAATTAIRVAIRIAKVEE